MIVWGTEHLGRGLLFKANAVFEESYIFYSGNVMIIFVPNLLMLFLTSVHCRVCALLNRIRQLRYRSSS